MKQMQICQTLSILFFFIAVEENFRIFNEMRSGTPNGVQYCLRAKIDYMSDNGCLRDPVLYRCRDEHHLVHGKKYVYVLYDVPSFTSLLYCEKIEFKLINNELCSGQ